jgi:hypothetical protein
MGRGAGDTTLAAKVPFSRARRENKFGMREQELIDSFGGLGLRPLSALDPEARRVIDSDGSYFRRARIQITQDRRYDSDGWREGESIAPTQTLIRYQPSLTRGAHAYFGIDLILDHKTEQLWLRRDVNYGFGFNNMASIYDAKPVGSDLRAALDEADRAADALTTVLLSSPPQRPWAPEFGDSDRYLFLGGDDLFQDSFRHQPQWFAAHAQGLEQRMELALENQEAWRRENGLVEESRGLAFDGKRASMLRCPTCKSGDPAFDLRNLDPTMPYERIRHDVGGPQCPDPFHSTPDPARRGVMRQEATGPR